MADQRAASFTTRSIKTTAKDAGLKLAISMVDLTTLEGKDSPEKVRALCQKALSPDPSFRNAEGENDTPMVGAVCVYPELVAVAKDALNGAPIGIASVATGFPSGQYPLDIRLKDAERAIDAGATEIDMVIARGTFLKGDLRTVAEEIARTKEVCNGRAHLKVILETGELETYDNVRLASDLSIHAGLTEGDFIKTSTGKVSPAATMPVTLVMLEAIRDHYLRTGVKIGMKPAGGIRASKQALHYLVMVKETLGDEWLTPDLFRFGASSLLDDLLLQRRKLATGRYHAPFDLPGA
ncbi:MAG: deoxyribose-phosphate aldolase [Planctomycetota bacterium]